MFINRRERRIINGKKTKPKVEKPPVIIPNNYPKRKYSVDQWRRFILRKIIKRKGKHGICWIWVTANKSKPYGEIRVPMRNGTTKFLLPARAALWANGEPKRCKIWNFAPETRFDRTCGNRDCVNPRHLQPQE